MKQCARLPKHSRWYQQSAQRRAALQTYPLSANQSQATANAAVPSVQLKGHSLGAALNPYAEDTLSPHIPSQKYT